VGAALLAETALASADGAVTADAVAVAVGAEAAGGGASGFDEAHAAMHMEIAAIEIGLIIVSP